MPRIILLFCLNLPVIISPAQEKADTSLLTVLYQFSFNTDSLNKAKVHTENILLYVGKQSSWFVAFNIVERNRLIEEGAKQGKPAGFSLNDPAIMRLQSSTPQIYKHKKEGEYSEVRTFFKKFTWKESLPTFNWKLEGDTTTISGYRCLSASTNYKGRLYKAWYAPEIPVSDGPWKFAGLPGLILKITDAKNEVRFEMKSIQKAVNGEPVVIKMDKDLIVTTKKEYESLVDAAYEDPNVISGITGRTYKTSSTVTPRKRPKPTNAIEITE